MRRPITLDRKHRSLAVRWDKYEKEVLKQWYGRVETYSQLADKVNDFNLKRMQDGYPYCKPDRSPCAVVVQCGRLGFIDERTVTTWFEKREESRKKARSRNLYINRKEVFSRDQNRCVICGAVDELEFAHIVPFRQSRSNLVREAVVLCKTHHGEFDNQSAVRVKKVYKHLCACYDDYRDVYKLEKTSRYGARIVRTE